MRVVRRIKGLGGRESILYAVTERRAVYINRAFFGGETKRGGPFGPPHPRGFVLISREGEGYSALEGMILASQGGDCDEGSAQRFRLPPCFVR